MFRRLLFKAMSRMVLQPMHRQLRGLTLGTRTAVLDDGARVLLVRHHYAPGWMFPGGGVERGETLQVAALRELREEAGIVAEEAPQLHGVFLNDRQFPGDHVACFVLRHFRQEIFKPSLEIAEARFFALDALPDGITGGHGGDWLRSYRVSQWQRTGRRQHEHDAFGRQIRKEQRPQGSQTLPLLHAQLGSQGTGTTPVTAPVNVLTV